MNSKIELVCTYGCGVVADRIHDLNDRHTKKHVGNQCSGKHFPRIQHQIRLHLTDSRRQSGAACGIRSCQHVAANIVRVHDDHVRLGCAVKSGCKAQEGKKNSN